MGLDLNTGASLGGVGVHELAIASGECRVYGCACSGVISRSRDDDGEESANPSLR